MAVYTAPGDHVFYVGPEKAKAFLSQKPDPTVIKMHRERAAILYKMMRQGPEAKHDTKRDIKVQD